MDWMIKMRSLRFGSNVKILYSGDKFFDMCKKNRWDMQCKCGWSHTGSSKIGMVRNNRIQQLMVWEIIGATAISIWVHLQLLLSILI